MEKTEGDNLSLAQVSTNGANLRHQAGMAMWKGVYFRITNNIKRITNNPCMGH
jgi:hypothetical protein